MIILIIRKMYKPDFPKSFVYEENTLTDKGNIVNSFNDYFSSVGKKLADEIQDVSYYQFIIILITLLLNLCS